MDRATGYARRVVRGEVPCGRLHMLACKRHLDDLKRQGDPAFPYAWDEDASERAIRYGEMLTIVEGFERRSVKLLDCQAFDIGCTFGWKRLDGFRRFRSRYKCMARQQGKSFENGILGTYVAGFGGYSYGQLYTAATKKRQAKIAWNEMKKFIEADPELSELFDVKEYKLTITALETKCTIEALSREGGIDDGFRPIFASVDELHQMRDNSVYKALQNGSRTLPETLISMITTRGFDTESFAYEMDGYAISVLEGTVGAEDFFVDIYALDDGDDPFDESNWIKANPLLASTERGMEQLRSEAAKARAMGGSELRDFLTKCMNVWVTKTEDTFIAPEDWRRCKTNLTLEDFRGERCWVGIDLSSGGDLTTVALEFEHNGKGAYCYSHSFMPRGRMAEHIASDVAPYDLWHKDGLITLVGGQGDFRTDYHFVVNHLRSIVDEYGLDVQAIGYDKHNADAFTADLEQFGAPLIEVVQSARNLNDATVDVQLLAKQGDFAVDGRNDLMSWSFMNARLVRNSFDEVKVDKKPGKVRRIDPVDACIDAHYARLVQRECAVVDVDEEMARYLEMMNFG